MVMVAQNTTKISTLAMRALGAGWMGTDARRRDGPTYTIAAGVLLSAAAGRPAAAGNQSRTRLPARPARRPRIAGQSVGARGLAWHTPSLGLGV